MSHKKKADAVPTDAIDERQTPAQEAEAEAIGQIDAAREALGEAVKYLGTEGWNWLQLGTILRPAADHTHRAFSIANRQAYAAIKPDKEAKPA